MIADDIDKLLLELTIAFRKEYIEEALKTGMAAMAFKTNIKKRIEKAFTKSLQPIINDYFNKGISLSNKIVSSEISQIVNQTNVPFKYNKDLFNTFNDKESIFTGYADRNYKSLFSKREIDAIKRQVLTGKYSGWTDKQVRDAIKGVANITNNRALNIARTETTRLQTAATQIYYQDPKVQAKYDKVFITEKDGKVRPSHKSYDGKIADKDGYFDGDCGKIIGAPVACSPWNCRCRVELRLK